MPTLDTPLTLPSGLVLPNRIAKAPMTENLADADNQPTARHERVYRRWAQGGAGLLVTGNLMVDRRYLERSHNVVADRHLDLRRLARVREAAGSTPMIAQLSHPGRQTNRFLARHPVAPSGGKAVSMLGLFGKPRNFKMHRIVGDRIRVIHRRERSLEHIIPVREEDTSTVTPFCNANRKDPRTVKDMNETIE